jgi:crossover junction endodeoxyribonuclease RusA
MRVLDRDETPDKRVFLEIELPYPPSVNRVWQRGKGGRVFLSQEAIAFRNATVMACKTKRVMAMAGDVFLDIALYRPRRIGDMDNPLKALFDGLTHGGVWLDDSQAKEMRVLLLDDKESPRVVLKITGERFATLEEIQAKRELPTGLPEQATKQALGKGRAVSAYHSPAGSQLPSPAENPVGVRGYAAPQQTNSAQTRRRGPR